MGHSYAQRCTVYKNWNLRFCLETHHHQKIKTPSPKQKKQHCNINDTTPSYHPLIIKTSQHHHHTSRRLHRICPRRHQHIAERSPKHHQKTKQTKPKQPRDITKKNRDRDMTETSQRHRQNNTETRQRQDQERTETRPRHHGDKEASSVDIRATATLVCPKVHNIQIQIRI